MCSCVCGGGDLRGVCFLSRNTVCIFLPFVRRSVCLSSVYIHLSYHAAYTFVTAVAILSVSARHISPRGILPPDGNLQYNKHDQGHEGHVVPNRQSRGQHRVDRTSQLRHHPKHILPALDPVQHWEQVHLRAHVQIQSI